MWGFRVWRFRVLGGGGGGGVWGGLGLEGFKGLGFGRLGARI